MQKRISAFVVAILMFVMIVPVSVFSQGNNIADSTINDVKPLYEENEETVYDKVGIYENLKYGIKDGFVTIIGYVGDLDGELVIPETMGGYPVTTIGKGAFCGYPITSVSMPSVTTIGNIAFARCYYLTRISMPHIQTVTGSAFAACTSLAKIDLGSNNEYFITENNILYSNDKKILYYCYPSSSIKGKFEVDDNVTTIGEYAFYYNCDLTEISMQNVITIGDANGDEVLDSSDATEILRIVAQLEELKINEKYADVNGDGIIDSADATKILRYVAHLEQW